MKADIDFSARLRSLRMSLGLGQEDFAMICKNQPTHNTIRNWEHGKSSPAVDEFENFPQLGIDATAYIVGHTEQPYSMPIEVVCANVAAYLEKAKRGK